MEFGETFIFLFGFKLFEPMVMLTNIIFFTLCAIYFRRLNAFGHPYSKQMAWFIFLLGISSMFGATAHMVHKQLGELVFKTLLFIMNAFSAGSIYFCFRSAYTYTNPDKEPSKLVLYTIIIWLALLLIACTVYGNFLVILVHAGLTLLYSLIAHYLVYRKTHDKGSLLVITGILISYVAIIALALRITLSIWFNHKDIAHVIMIISLIAMYQGVRTISEKLSKA